MYDTMYFAASYSRASVRISVASGKRSLVNPLKIFEHLVDRTFGQVQAFCWVCALDDLFAHLGVQSEEPLEEIAI